MPTALADCYSPLRNCSIRGLDFQGVEIHKLQVGEITLKAFIQSICTLQKFCLMLLLFFFKLNQAFYGGACVKNVTIFSVTNLL